MHTYVFEEPDRKKKMSHLQLLQECWLLNDEENLFLSFALTSGQTKKSWQTWSKSYTNKMHTEHQR